MKNIKDLSNILDIKNQKKDFDKLINDILNIIKNNTSIDIYNNEIFLNKNKIKIKTNSNKKFVLFLNLNKLNQSLKSLNKDIILEL